MTSNELLPVLAQLEYERDDRGSPDNLRRGQFRTGWEDATVRGQDFTEETLRLLTWNNLGFRVGKAPGYQPVDEIEQAYELLAAMHEDLEVDGTVAGPTEATERAPLFEGAPRQVVLNVHERNPEARRRCLSIHGTSCSVCGFNFGRTYGLLAEGFIHVHHLEPLHGKGGEHQVDPERDPRPVCPNCHAVIHRRTPPYGIDQVKAFLRK